MAEKEAEDQQKSENELFDIGVTQEGTEEELKSDLTIPSSPGFRERSESPVNF